MYFLKKKQKYDRQIVGLPCVQKSLTPHPPLAFFQIYVPRDSRSSIVGRVGDTNAQCTQVNIHKI
jgi:hypothetical protein